MGKIITVPRPLKKWVDNVVLNIDILAVSHKLLNCLHRHKKEKSFQTPLSSDYMLFTVACCLIRFAITWPKRQRHPETSAPELVRLYAHLPEVGRDTVTGCP